MRSAALRLAATAALALPAAFPAVSVGAEGSAPGEIQVFIENDILARTDRYYTNGIKLGLGGRLEAVREPLRLPAQWALDRLACAQKDCPGAEDHVGLFAGQNMYTPRSITQAAPQPNDRPWAAFLYAGVVAQRVRESTLDTAEFDAGVVGPLALGRQVQRWWHEHISHSPEPLGWGNQLPNEPVFLLSYVHKKRLDFPRSSPLRGVEVIPHAGFSAGTVATFARAGGMVRLGRNMTGFGPDNIEPGGASLQSTFDPTEGAKRKAREYYFFLGADMRLVAHNIFLDGTVFHDSPSVDRRLFVYDITGGFSYRESTWPFRLSVVRIRRSEEFTTALGGGGKQIYHSINIGFNF